MAESGSGCLQGTRSVEMLDWSLVLDGFRGPWLGSLLSAHSEQPSQMQFSYQSDAAQSRSPIQATTIVVTLLTTNGYDSHVPCSETNASTNCRRRIDGIGAEY